MWIENQGVMPNSNNEIKTTMQSIPAEPVRPTPGLEPGPSTGAVPPDDAPDEATAPAQVLVADSAIQFFDWTISETVVAAVASRYFECRDDRAEQDGDDGVLLHQVVLDENGTFYHPITHRIEHPDRTYPVDGHTALKAFAGSWLPLPVMRVASRDGRDALEEGPSNWARVLVAPHDATGGYRLVLAIDTSIIAASIAGTGGAREAADVGPTAQDVRDATSFRFSSDVHAISWFVTEPWVDEWVKEAHRDGLRARPTGSQGKRPDPASANQLEHLSHYLTFLAVLEASGCVPELQFLPDPAATQPGPDAKASIAVDLVLDLGASRTTALLAERTEGATGSVAITQLPLRDLTQPWRVHQGPFSSRLEFSRVALGKDVYSRWSGRANGFSWPSLARVGHEATRLASEQAEADAFTGLSSAIRYVWDERPTRHVWRFSTAGAQQPPAGAAVRRNPLVSGPLMAHLSETGDVLDAGDKRVGTAKPRFSRSALLTFFAGEVIVQAIAAINAPAYRASRGNARVPRHLARIVLTLPTAMQHLETEIVRRRVEEAVRLVGMSVGWTDKKSTASARPGSPPQSQSRQAAPAVLVSADGATCAQVAFVNNEVAHKFRGKAQAYFDLTGKIRQGGGTARSVRIATLDIGGGTTSLAIATWSCDPVAGLGFTRNFLDGFRIGSDDIAKSLIKSLVLPAIERRLHDCRLPDPRGFLQSIVSGATHGRASRLGEYRRRFASELAHPAAIAMLQTYMMARARFDDQPFESSLASLLSGRNLDLRAVADELETLASDEGADGFLPLDTEITFTARDIASAARDVLAPVLAGAVHAIRQHDCDVVVLAGWISQLPVVRDILLESMPIRPDRIVAAYDYRMGAWYPRAHAAGQSSACDPKLLPAVGAVLLEQPQPRIANLPLAAKPYDVGHRPCVIGLIGSDGTIADDEILFDKLGASAEAHAREPLLSASCSIAPPVVVGVRRAPLAGWPALPMFAITVEDVTREAAPRMPLRVALEWDRSEQGGMRLPRIVRATDADGIDLAEEEISLRLQTLGADAGHWLDTGVLNFV